MAAAEDATNRSEELIALLSIYEPDDRSLPVRIRRHDADGDLSIEVDVVLEVGETSISSTYNGVATITQCTHLPPITLNVSLPHDYPSTSPPTLTIKEDLWTTQKLIDDLHDQLLTVWEEYKGMGVLFAWITHCTDVALHLRSTDPQSLVPLTINCDTLCDTQSLANARYVNILAAADESAVRLFARGAHDCDVCFSVALPGAQCVRFMPCSHVFCVLCVREYFTLHVTEGTLSHLGCLTKDCKSVATPVQIRAVLDDAELYARYDSLTLDRGLELMTDVARCPRPSCNQPVIVELPPPDGTSTDEPSHQVSTSTADVMHVMMQRVTATCAHCSYTFCTYCRKSNHGVAPCAITATDRKRILHRYETGSPSERADLERQYGAQTLQRIIQDAQNMHWISENAKPCPQCHTAIQKSDGCNKIHCAKCNQNFCWICGKRIYTQNPYDHFNNAANKECYQQLFHGVEVHSDDDEWEGEEEQREREGRR